MPDIVAKDTDGPEDIITQITSIDDLPMLVKAGVKPEMDLIRLRDAATKIYWHPEFLKVNEELKTASKSGNEQNIDKATAKFVDKASELCSSKKIYGIGNQVAITNILTITAAKLNERDLRLESRNEKSAEYLKNFLPTQIPKQLNSGLLPPPAKTPAPTK